MTERKKLKKELSRLKAKKKILPMLIDCSQVYGDNYFNKNYELILDSEIASLIEKIKKIDEA